MQSSSVNMLNHCIDMLLVPLTRPCFWLLRIPSVCEMLVRSKKTLRTPYTLGTGCAAWWSTGKIQSAGNSGVAFHANLYSLSPRWKDHNERYYSLTVNLFLLGKIWDNTGFLQNKSGPSFILEVTSVEVNGYSPLMSTKPALGSVSNLMVRDVTRWVTRCYPGKG